MSSRGRNTRSHTKQQSSSHKGPSSSRKGQSSTSGQKSPNLSIEDDIELDEFGLVKSNEDPGSSDDDKFDLPPTENRNLESQTPEPLLRSKTLIKEENFTFKTRYLKIIQDCMIRMYNLKYSGFILVGVLSCLITFGVTTYFNNQEIKCTKEPELSPDMVAKNHTKALRLPRDIIPINYDIKLQPFMRLDQLFFKGSVSILLSCQNETDKIQLNVNELEINNTEIVVGLMGRDDRVIQRLKVQNTNLKSEILTVELDQNLRTDERYSIFIPFKANLTTSLAGFYRSSYTDVISKQTRYLAMTQFQATDARRAFPCWDEPAFKARFDIEITHWRNMTAISNMPEKDVIYIDSDWVKTKFERTVQMSTYLVAFAVGDFKFKQQADPDAKPKFRIVTRPTEVDSASTAILYGPRILKYFESYFNITFPLPKIDMLACPDFAAGAMENWGLITYRESTLLFDRRVGSVLQLYRITSVIAHELAHQWFGNLVTPIYWNDLWLNEGFATFVSYLGVNSVQPSWKIFDRFVVDELHDVLSLDCLKNSHPISVEVNDPNEISELFDHVTYSKGASIIRMMTHIIGQDTFLKGVRTYLKDFAYGNAEQAHLWMHLQQASDEDNTGLSKVNVTALMDSWTLKEGYPLITITRDYSRDTARFSQKRFMLNSNDTNALIKTQYEVAISYTTKQELVFEPKIKLWLHKTEDGEESFEEVQLNISKNDWIIANLQQTNYYRVTYDDDNWNLLIKQLHEDHTKIHRVNRAQILDDLFRLAENDVVKYRKALWALEYLKNEKDPLIWSALGTNTYSINKMLRRTESYGSWQKYIRQLIQPAWNRFKLEKLGDENLEDNQMQRTIVSIACGYNQVECVQKSRELFNEFMRDPSVNKIPPNVRPSVYCTAISHGDELEWDFIFNLYLKEQNANERNNMLSALTCSRVPWILARYLKWMFDESSGIKSQDGVFVFKSVASQNYGKDIAFNYLRENWETIYSIHGTKMSFAHIVKSLETINSAFELELVKTFYKSIGSKVGSAKRAFLLTIEQIESNIMWMKRYEPEIADFLTEFERRNA